MSISGHFIVKATAALLLVGFAALMAIVGISFFLGERAQSYFENATAARDTRIAAVELRNALQTAEASERGFIVTGNEIYLAPYQTAKFQAQRQYVALQALKGSDPSFSVALDRLNTLLASKFEEFDRLIDLKRNQRDAEVLSIFRTNTGKSLTDEANVYFAGIIGKADSELTAGVAEQRVNSAWLRLISGVGALVIITMVGIAVYGIAQYTRELRATRDQLNALNADLELRVTRRTLDLAQARERAEVLLTEVNHRVANSLALVASLVNLQSKILDDPTAKAALLETQDRIFAISLVHKRLYSSTDIRTVEIHEYVSGLLDHLRSSMRSQAHGVSLAYDIDRIELETDISLNLGVVITELVTNAFKYAYPDGVGEIRVRLTKSDDVVELVVEDDGVGWTVGAPAKGTGLGSRIVNAMCRSLGAKIDFRQLQPGMAAHLAFSSTSKRATAAT